MLRFIWGGLCLLTLFVPGYSYAQVKIKSAVDGKPVTDAIVHFTGSSRQQKTSFTDSTGTVPFPGFVVHLVSVYATGFRQLTDTLKGNDFINYSLVPLNVQMDEVVITGQYQPNLLSNSVFEVQVFDQKNLELRAANNLSDLLQHDNSVLISRDPFLGAGININGISGNNVKILIDGVPVIGRENGNIDLSQIDLANIERVELVRGPMSETYGSDALAGVINLISKKKKNEGTDAGGKFYYESNGTYNIHANSAYRKKGQEITIHAGRNFFDGYSEFDTVRSQQWKPKEQYNADLGYALRFKKGSLRYQAGVSKEKLISKGNIIATPYEAYAFDDFYNTIRTSHKIFIDKELKNHASVNFTNAFSNYERSRDSYRKNMVSLENSGLTANNYTNLFRQYLFRGTYSTYRAWKKINYQVGYDVTLDEARGDRTGSVTRRINDFAAFGSAELTYIKKVVIRPALRVIYNTRYAAPLVPSLHIKYDPRTDLSVRASVARGFRAPSVKELYLDFEDSNHNLKGNTSLQPELSDYAQISAEYRKKTGAVAFSIKPDVFFNHIYNKITLAEINSNALEYTYINIDDYRNIGGNLNLHVSARGLSLGAGVNFTAYHNRFAGQGIDPGFSQTVNLNGSLSYNFAKAGFTTGLFFKRFGKVTVYSMETETLTAYHIRDYYSMDLTINKSLFKKSVVISGGIKNIFDNTTSKGGTSGNDIHSGGGSDALIGMGRYYFGGLQFVFGKN